mgnify:CR=1 FL=1
MPNSTSENTVLNNIVGYQEIVDHQQALIKTGTDHSEHKGQVTRTIDRLHPKRLALTVTEIVENTPSTKTLRVRSVDGNVLPPFQAGQYINLFVNIDGTETARPYAISSSPKDLSYYDLTIKRATPGYVTHYLLDRVQVDDKMTSTGPMGTFYHNPIFHGEKLVFLAGGSGIAPAMTMIRDIADQEKPYHFQLIYLSSYETDVIFDQELEALDKECDFLSIHRIISRPSESYQGLSGRLSVETLSDLLGETSSNSDKLNEKMYYICGPTPFNEACSQQLQELNVKARRIRIEANGPPKNPESIGGWPEDLPATEEVTVTIQGKGSFKARVDEPLLNSMERNGYSTENACRSGECSLCRVKVVKGAVFNPPEAHLRKTDAQYGWCHSCVAFPTEDIEIII